MAAVAAAVESPVASNHAPAPPAVPVSIAPAVRARLSEPELEALTAVLTGKHDYMPNQAFEAANAERTILLDREPVPQPDIGWYVPVMERLSDSPPNNLSASLFTPEQERTIFLQFNYCRFRAARLRRKLARRVRSLEQARDLLYWHARAQALRDQIANGNLALVLAMIKRMRLADLDFADLVSEGNMALLRAIDKFDVARGFKFSTYACRAIIKAYSRYGTRYSRYRQVFPVEFDPEFEKSDYIERKNDQAEADCASELKRIIQENRAKLTDVERTVIEHRFALGAVRAQDAEARPLTLLQVGKLIGLTKERVRQIQNAAMEKLRVALDHRVLA